MDHWGYTDEVKKAARKRRRLIDKQVVTEHIEYHEPPIFDSRCGGITNCGIVYRQDATL